MTNETCILTTKDLRVLEDIRERWQDSDHVLALILSTKIRSARVVQRSEVPTDVATLNSRVTFSVDDKDVDTRLISHDRVTSPVGMFLPITTPRGLALLGLTEGQGFRVTSRSGVEEHLVLTKVQFQPEAGMRTRATDG